MKQWRCRNDHILGFIRWYKDLPQLMVLRQAMDMKAEHPDEVDLLGPLSGSMPVRCSICGDVKPWKLSVDGMVAIWMNADDTTVFDFSRRLLELSEKVVDLDDPAVPASFTPPLPSPNDKEQVRHLGEKDTLK